MPRGQKTCPACNKGCGPRSAKCPHCGHKFEKKVKKTYQHDTQSSQSPQSSKTKGKRSSSTSASPFTARIATPSGPPPVKPRGYSSTENRFPNGYDDSVISDWAQAVKDKSDSANISYLSAAVKYWARYFWDIHDTEEFKRVSGVIDQTLGASPVASD